MLGCRGDAGEFAFGGGGGVDGGAGSDAAPQSPRRFRPPLLSSTHPSRIEETSKPARGKPAHGTRRRSPGQGYNAFTPLQQAQAIAIIANDGVAFRPHLAKGIENVSTGEVRQIAPEPAYTVAVKPEHLAVIKNALIGVVREGTSARAFVGAGYVSAGKTGTAQVYSLKGEKYSAGHVDERLRDHAWYLAYAPADHPRIALSVLVENGGWGATAAAPIARAVFDYYLLGQKAAAAALPAPTQREPEDESD